MSFTSETITSSTWIWWCIMMWEDNRGWIFHSWNPYDGFWIHILARGNGLKLSVSYEHTAFHFTTLTDGVDWSGVDYLLWFLSAVWTLILTAPIHCWGSIGEQVMYCYISPNLFLQTLLTFLISWCYQSLLVFNHRLSTICCQILLSIWNV